MPTRTQDIHRKPRGQQVAHLPRIQYLHRLMKHRYTLLWQVVDFIVHEDSHVLGNQENTVIKFHTQFRNNRNGGNTALNIKNTMAIIAIVQKSSINNSSRNQH